MTTFNEETSRDLLVCLLWVLKNSDSSVLRHWWTHMSRDQLQHLIQLLDLSIASFEYKGKKQMKRHHRIGAGGHASVLTAISTCASTKKTSMISVKNQLEKSIIGTENARTEMLNRNKQKNPLPSIHGHENMFYFISEISFDFDFFQNQPKPEIIFDGEKIKHIGDKRISKGNEEENHFLISSNRC